MTPEIMGIIEELDRAREEKSMTWVAIAEIAGVTPQTMWHWRRGDFMPRMDGLILALDAVGLKLAAIPK